MRRAEGGETACFDDDELVAWVEGGLDDARRRPLLAHLEGCDDCRRLVSELARASATPSAPGGATPRPEAPADQPPGGAGPIGRGTPLGRYVVLGALGAGAMGVVYEVYDPELDRRVALKLLRAAVGASPAADERLRREAHAMARVAHPNVVPVFDAGLWGGRVYLTMELVEGGRTLARWLADERPRLARVLAAFAQAGEGLAAAHAAGVVHRDFKPDNVLIGPDGRARVTDFGVASVGRPAAGAPAGEGRSFVGTPAYMAPEQMLGQPADAKSDQFSFCVALYEALYGERPFDAGAGGSWLASLSAGGLRAPARGARGRVPGALRRALERGLHADPAERHASMEALARALRRAGGAGRRRAAWAVAAALALLGLGAGAALRGTARPASACGPPEQDARELLGDERRAAVRKALGEGAGGDEAWASLERSLDRYATEWASLRHAACVADEAAPPRPGGPAVGAARECLERRRLEFDALVRELAAGAAPAPRAAEAAFLLTDLRACGNARALAASASGPADAARLEELRRAIADARAALALGRPAESVPRATRAVELARSLGNRYFEGEALIALGSAHLGAGAFGEAERHLTDAYRSSDAAGDDLNRAYITAPLSFLAGCVRRAPAEGHRWLELGFAAAERSEGGRALEGSLRAAEGSLLGCEGRGREAIDVFGRALELLDGTPAHEPSTVRTLLNLVVERHNLGDYDTAPLLDRAERLARAALGPTHPWVGRAHFLWCESAFSRGLYREARDHADQARRALEAALGRGHRDTLRTWGNLCSLDALSGTTERALACQRDALAEAERSLGADDEVTAELRTQLGALLVDAGHAREALPALRRSLGVLRARRGADDPTLGATYVPLGEALLGLGRGREALAELKRAERLFARLDPGPVDRAGLHFALARALAPTDRARARRLAESARALYGSVGGEGLPDRVARIDAWLAGAAARARPRPRPRAGEARPAR
ncbi:MAG TPA: protein kinase [Polyangiaceae bacterium]|nr:protein kinase [Polyangiaceae bacterium]